VVKLSGGTTYKASGEAWSTLSIGVTAESLSGISCASASVCTTGGLQDATYTTGSVNLGYQGAVLTTTNGGTSWTSSLTNGAPPTNLLANALLVDGPSFFSCPTSSACLAGGQEGVVSTQDDNVAPWTGAFLTPVMSTATQVNCVSLLACYLSPGSDVTYRSSGGGVGWNPENLPTTEKNGSSFSGPTNSVSESSCNGTSLCAFLGNTIDAAYDEGWSSDGQTWAAQAGNAASGTTFTALSCFTVATGYCIYFEKPSSSAATIAVTGPCTLTTCPSLATPSGIENADGSSCVGSQDCWVVGQTTSGDGAVWMTINAGVSWTQDTTFPLNGTVGFSTVSPISCSDVQDCVVANSAGAFTSTSNGGTSWSTTFSAGSTVNSESSLSCPDADDCVAIVGTTVPSTELVALTDTGSTWSATPSSLPSPYTSASSVTCAAAADCWAVAWNGYGNEAVISTNGQDGPADGPLTPGESFAGNMAEGHGQSPQAWEGDVDTADGDYSESVPMISIPARGMPFGFSLTYDAQLAQDQVAFGASSSGPYGWGWTGTNSLSITAGPLSSQVTVNQQGGAQVVYNESSGPVYTATNPNRVLATLNYSSGTGDYTFSLNGGLQKYLFSASGPTAAGTLVAEEDANGYVLSFGSEAKGVGACPNLSSVTNCSTITEPSPDSRVITVVNATSGLVSEVIDPATNTWLLGYDSHDNLVTVTDPKMNVTTFGYDTGNSNANLVHDMTKITPPRNVGNALIAYDALGRVYCQVAPAEQVALSISACPSISTAWSWGYTRYQYSGSDSSTIGGATTITDPHGSITIHDYAYGTLVATTSGIGTAAPATVSIERDPMTLLGALVTDPDGHTTTTVYNTAGYPKTVTDPLGNVTTTTYNTTFNEPLTVTDPKGITTTYTYDADGNELTKTVSAPGTDTGSPGWTKATVESGVAIQGLSCPSATVCVGVDHSGDVLWATNPIGGSSAWTKVNISLDSLNGISCPNTGFCAAVGTSGQVEVADNPTGSYTAWSAATIDGSTAINAISCPTVGEYLCVATDAAGNVLTTTNPNGGASAWTKTNIDGSTSISAVSCASASLCVATDVDGDVLTTTNPTGGSGAWATTDIDGSTAIDAVSCPSVSLCVAGDASGNVLTATSPTGGSGSWTSTDIDGSTALEAVSCASVTLCVASDDTGDVLGTANPTAGAGAWSKTNIDGTADLDAVSCLTTPLCVTADTTGAVATSPDPTGVPAWSKGAADSSNAIEGMSCPSTTLCVGTDNAGDILYSITPTITGSGWTKDNVSSHALDGISCPRTTLCVAVGADGQVETAATNPAGGSWGLTTPDGSTTINAVSCPTASLCVAADAAGNVLINTNPTGTTWTTDNIDGSTSLLAVSCASVALCVATDASGDVLTTTTPGGSWTKTDVDGTTAINAISCPSASLCVAGDASGDVLTATTPIGGSWTKTDVDSTTALKAVGCASSSLCVTTDNAGGVLTADAPTGGVTAWAEQGVDGTTAIDAVSCVTISVCVAGDVSGNVISSANAAGTLASTTTNTLCETSCPTGYETGDIESVTDPDGHVTTYTYDSQGDVTTTTVTVGAQTDTTTDKYDTLGQKYCQITPNANAASVTCAAMGSHTADTTTWAYDPDGNVTSTIDADGNTTSTTYDADNNVTQVKDGLSNETETVYDADDRKTSVTAGYGSTSATTTSYTYDIQGTSCPSTPAGLLYCTQVENALSQTTTSYFNALNQMIESTPPNSTTQTQTTYTYDGVGNILTTVDGSGTRLTLTMPTTG
jgi:YD repeat-containing protein